MEWTQRAQAVNTLSEPMPTGRKHRRAGPVRVRKSPLLRNATGCDRLLRELRKKKSRDRIACSSFEKNGDAFTNHSDSSTLTGELCANVQNPLIGAALWGRCGFLLPLRRAWEPVSLATNVQGGLTTTANQIGVFVIATGNSSPLDSVPPPQRKTEVLVNDR